MNPCQQDVELVKGLSLEWLGFEMAGESRKLLTASSSCNRNDKSSTSSILVILITSELVAMVLGRGWNVISLRKLSKIAAKIVSVKMKQNGGGESLEKVEKTVSPVFS